ncbi:hypothetical protein RI367_000478 [Sorochytrium milnesiophthora]
MLAAPPPPTDSLALQPALPPQQDQQQQQQQTPQEFAVPAPRSGKKSNRNHHQRPRQPKQQPSGDTASDAPTTDSAPQTPRSSATSSRQRKRHGSPVTPHPSLVQGQVNQLRGHKQSDGTVVEDSPQSQQPSGSAVGRGPSSRRRKFQKMGTPRNSKSAAASTSSDGADNELQQSPDSTVRFNPEPVDIDELGSGAPDASPRSVNANVQPARNFKDMLHDFQHAKAKKIPFANLKPMSSPKLAPHSSDTLQQQARGTEEKDKMTVVADDLRTKLTHEIKARQDLETRVHTLETIVQHLVQRLGIDPAHQDLGISIPVSSVLSSKPPLDLAMSSVSLSDEIPAAQ